ACAMLMPFASSSLLSLPSPFLSRLVNACVTSVENPALLKPCWISSRLTAPSPSVSSAEIRFEARLDAEGVCVCSDIALDRVCGASWGPPHPLSAAAPGEFCPVADDCCPAELAVDASLPPACSSRCSNESANALEFAEICTDRSFARRTERKTSSGAL